MYECMFDLDGNILCVSEAVEVKRVGETLVIEFINNLLLPLRIVQSKDGGFDCRLISSTVVRVYPDRPSQRVIMLSIERIAVIGSIDFIIQVGDGQSYWLDGHYGTVQQDNSIYLDSLIYDSFGVLRWAKQYGVNRVFGCSYSESLVSSVNFGCCIVDNACYCLVQFANGMSFPVFRTQSGVLVCGEYYTRRFPNMLMLFVKVYEIRSGYVRFRLVLYEPDTFHIFDNIEFASEGIRYEDNFISTRLLTKQLVMGVVDEYGSL